MAVKNFPNVSPDANPSFTLEFNTSSFESSLNKSVQHMELPGARWRGSVAFSNRNRQEASKIKAFMTSLGGQVGRFYLTPFDAYQSGTMSGTGVVDGAVASGVSSIPTKGWDGDQDTLFEAGDYIEVNGELKMVTGDVAGSDYIEYVGTNYMPSPFDPSGWYPDTDGTITNITIENASGQTFMGLANVDVDSSFFLMNRTFNTVVSEGEAVYAAIIARGISPLAAIRCQIQNQSGAQIYNSYINSTTGNTFDNGDGPNKIDILPSGDILMQFKYIVESGVTDVDVNLIFWNLDQTGGASGLGPPKLGDQQYVQAAFFGKADDYPAQLLATADIPIAPLLRKSLTGGESITVDSPKGKFYLGSDSQEWSINVNGVQSMGFDFIEDVN